MDSAHERMLIAKADGAHFRGSFDEARGLFEQALSANPESAKAHHGLSLIYRAKGEAGKAIEHLRRAVAAEDEQANWHYELGTLLSDEGRMEEAIEPYRRAEELEPDNAAFSGSLALVYRRVRDDDSARATAERAIQRDPKEHNARLALAQIAIKRGELDEAESHLNEIIDCPYDGSVRAIAWHHMGQVLDRRERWGDAFDAHMKGNEIMLATPTVQQQFQVPLPPFLPFLNYAEQYKQWGKAEYGDGVPGPIVLAGFPRSGTTMVEQILGAHPLLATIEERPVTAPVRREMVAMMRANRQARPPGDDLEGLTDDQVRQLRTTYRRTLEGSIDEGLRDRILIDKGPLRTLDLGLFNRIFPETRVILMIRDPRDIVLSGLFQYFKANQAMVRFLTPELAADLYETVIGYWLKIRSMLTIDVMQVRYEDVVRDFDTWGRRIVEYAGVEWDEKVRSFHEFAGDRVVRSASYESVTQKLNTRAIGRWKHCADRLAPILPKLEPFVEEFGYEPTSEALRG